MATTKTDDGREITAPIIHLNGSSATALCEGFRCVYDALKAAEEVMAQAAPHGRDYYPEPGSFERARDEYRARRDVLDRLLEDYAALALSTVGD